MADRLYVCPTCAQEFVPRRESSRFCSRPCMWKANGKNQKKQPEVWWTNSRGYIEGRVTIDGVTRRVRQHRWIVEQYIGRSLIPAEDVHHINGNKSDNRIENLEVICHRSHTAVTNENREYRRGYRLNLSEAERARRSEWLKSVRARAALAKALGGQP